MPTLLETAAALNNLLNIGWAGRTDIAIDNVPYSEVNGQAYIESIFIPYTTYNVNIGSGIDSSCERKRTEGVLQIIVRTPINEGIGLAYSYSNDISGIMDNKNPIPNLFTYVTEVRRSGDNKDGWYTLICDVPFVSDEIN